MAGLTSDPGADVGPRVSVVVCTHDRVDKLASCLAGLAAQTLDSSHFNVVVIDDCSIDAPDRVAEHYKARVIRNAHSLGPAASRNIGSKATTAPIIAFTDDDCVPDPDWLGQLIDAFVEPDVLAVGGQIRPLRTDRLLLRYYEACNPLAHNPHREAHAGGLVERFAAYLRTSFRLGSLDPSQEDLLTIASANLAIRRSEFEALGGFDERFGLGGEDDDLSLRLRKLRPAGRLRYVPQAVVAHDYDPSLRDGLRRNRTYGRAAAIGYLKGEGRLPAIYPFPFLILVSFVLAVINIALLAVPFLLLVALYPGWLRLALRRRNPAYAGFSLFQAAFELQATFGFLGQLLAERQFFPHPEYDTKAN
jgi:GT2 family glycosyltransferase